MLEDRKSVVFFKVSDPSNELEGPPLVKDSMFLSPGVLENELSKLRDKWVVEFDSVFDLYRNNMHTWIVDYINLNHNVYVSVFEACGDLFEIEKEEFEMKIKQEITIPPMQDYIFDLVEK